MVVEAAEEAQRQPQTVLARDSAVEEVGSRTCRRLQWGEVL